MLCWGWMCGITPRNGAIFGGKFAPGTPSTGCCSACPALCWYAVWSGCGFGAREPLARPYSCRMPPSNRPLGFTGQDQREPGSSTAGEATQQFFAGRDICQRAEPGQQPPCCTKHTRKGPESAAYGAHRMGLFSFPCAIKQGLTEGEFAHAASPCFVCNRWLISALLPPWLQRGICLKHPLALVVFLHHRSFYSTPPKNSDFAHQGKASPQSLHRHKQNKTGQKA